MRLNIATMKMYFLTCNNPTRRAHFLNEFKGYDVTEVHPVTGIPKNESGTIGFSRMLDLGSRHQDRTKPFQPFAIFEDDVKRSREIPESIDIPDDADILYIGLSSWGCNKDGVATPNSVLYTNIDTYSIQVYNMCATHGLIVCSVHGLLAIQKCMLESYFVEKAWDISLSQIHPYCNVYALKQPLVYQYGPLGGYERETKIHYEDTCAHTYDPSMRNTTNVSIQMCNPQQF